MRAEFWYLF